MQEKLSLLCAAQTVNHLQKQRTLQAQRFYVRFLFEPSLPLIFGWIFFTQKIMTVKGKRNGE